jgi:5-methylcytosine-specific restriction enzyme A
MARDEALFINGVYEDVLNDILEIQSALPEHIMYLQPYSTSPIVHLRENRPTPEDPVTVYLSITSDLSNVHFTAEIISWDDKQLIPEKKRNVLNRVIWTLQPKETGLYDASKIDGKHSVNLLHIRRLQRVTPCFSVSRLIKNSDGKPVSTGRTTAGGWAYVKKEVIELDAHV